MEKKVLETIKKYNSDKAIQYRLSGKVITALKRSYIPMSFKLSFQISEILCSLITGYLLIVIYGILPSRIHRSDVRHYDIGTGIEATDLPVLICSTESCGRWKQHMRIKKPHKGKHPQREIDTALRLVSERCVMMRDEWPDTDHLWPEIPQEQHILGKCPIR